MSELMWLFVSAENFHVQPSICASWWDRSFDFFVLTYASLRGARFLIHDPDFAGVSQGASDSGKKPTEGSTRDESSLRTASPKRETGSLMNRSQWLQLTLGPLSIWIAAEGKRQLIQKFGSYAEQETPSHFLMSRNCMVRENFPICVQLMPMNGSSVTGWQQVR